MTVSNTEGERALELQGRFGSTVDYDALPARVQERVKLVLLDLVGVTIIGSRTPELQALIGAWSPEVGAARIFGTGRSATPEAAALLNGAAACSLEMDEGNKHTQGHPAVHLVFGALAEAQASLHPVDGRTLLSAVVAGYEISARWGRALRRRAALHPHGHWGSTGAGAAVARVRGLDARGIAAAIDAAAGLIYVTPWDVVLAGSFVRNLWAAGSNVHGILGARLAAAGVSVPDGTALRSLREVGTVDLAELFAGLGERWYILEGYFKRHSSCSYTHPAVDAILELMASERFTSGQIGRIVVETHELSMPLARLSTGSRLAAMFSFPYVVAAAAIYGRVGPEAFSNEARADLNLHDLAQRTEVVHNAVLDKRLPDERPVIVTIELRDGVKLRSERPNPVGDASYFPLDREAVMEKLATMISRDDIDRINEVVEAIPSSADVSGDLARLP